jgi:outer membrane biosynthesis protein TonB
MRHNMKAGMGLGLVIAAAMSLPGAVRAQNVELEGLASDGGEVFQTIVQRGDGNLKSVQRAIGAGSRLELHANLDNSEAAPARKEPRQKMRKEPGSTRANKRPPATVHAPESKAPESKAPESKAPESKAPESKAPESKAPESKAPAAEVPAAEVPQAEAPEAEPVTVAPAGGEQETSKAAAAEAGGHLIVQRDELGRWKSLALTTDGAKARNAVKALRERGIEAAVFQYLPVPEEIRRLPLAPGVEALGLAVRLNGEVFAVAKDGRLFEVPLR